MLTTSTIKLWFQVHKWSSLICTAFMLMLCVTGLPLIFHHELDHLLGNEIEAPDLPEGTAEVGLDRVVEAAQRTYPDEVIQFVTWNPDDPNLRGVAMAPSLDTPPDGARFIAVDARTAEVLGEPRFQEGIMAFILTLHVDMFAGLPGKLFLGFMGLLFVVAIVSGLVLYGPFMRKLDFGTLRGGSGESLEKEGGTGRRRRLKWLDLHNLLGVVTLLWALVVGGTGVINTWVDLVIQIWRSDQLAEMVAPYDGKPLPRRLGSLADAVATAQAVSPGMTPAFVAYPGWLLSSNHHYGVFMRGEEPLTARLFAPVLVDAETGVLTDAREMPWYVKTLLVSQPLHFGDYGGMPLKIIWAVLDVITIVVLGSGLYLWLARSGPKRRRVTADGPAEAQTPAIEPVLARSDGAAGATLEPRA